jgi:hypothetical protein
MGKNSRSGIGDEPRAYKQFFGLKILKFFDADPDQISGIRNLFTLEPFSGGKNRIWDVYPGSGSRVKKIPDPGATLRSSLSDITLYALYIYELTQIPFLKISISDCV